MIKFRLIIKSFLPLAYLFIKKRATKEKGNTKGMGSYMKGTYFIENDIFKGFRGLNLNPHGVALIHKRQVTFIHEIIY